MSASPRDRDLARTAYDWLAQIALPQPEFDFVIAWASGYDELFSEVPSRTTEADALLDEALRVGRVLLHGEGGTGKSTIAFRLFRQALEKDLLPVFVDMRGWDAVATAAWEQWRGNELTRIGVLLTHLAQPTVAEETLGTLAMGRPGLLIVDGLNEAPAPVAEDLLGSLDAFARRNPHAGVITTDRLVRRRLPTESWSIAAIHEARLPSGTKHLTAASSLTRVAFFLDLAFREGLDSASGSTAFREYFERHASLRGEELAQVARAAYEAYRAAGARMFPFNEFSTAAGHAATDRLLTAGILAQDGPHGYFRHHLFHDFLAALWLSRDRRRWRNRIFNALTFGASSFDVLALALEELEDPASADALLRRIYDWNYYGSAYALAKGRDLGTVAATASMEIALLAMLAERRWDPLLATAQRVEDALRVFPGDLAEEFLSAPDFDELVAIVSGAVLDDTFEGWRRLFTTPVGTVVEDDTVEALASAESLIGWTTANVLKRVDLSASQRDVVRNLLKSDNEIVRWRAAHVLGAVPERKTVDTLFEALYDRDQWVRYGTVRSLVELAARDESLRSEVFQRMRKTITQLLDDPKVIGEFERAVLLREPPDDWIPSVAPIIEELWGMAASVEEQDHWRQVALRVRRQALSA